MIRPPELDPYTAALRDAQIAELAASRRLREAQAEMARAEAATIAASKARAEFRSQGGQ